jgi:phosphoserine phosphatase RsbU/P
VLEQRSQEPAVRDKFYLAGYLLLAGILLFLGRDFLQSSVVITWGLAFGGTTAAGVLMVLSNRLRLQLQASRHELARKEAELSFALEVQKSLFPRQLPCNYGLEFAAVCVPARGISGDFYDVIQLRDGRLAFAIADISGKGVPAAILMANLQAMLRIFSAANSSPAEVCARLNYHFHEVTDPSKFATFFYAQWDPARRLVHYVNAGHNPPILLGATGSQRLCTGGFPLGLFPSATFDVGHLSLQTDDLLVLYSDGITEASGPKGEEFGEARLESLVSGHRTESLEKIQEAVLEAVRRWSGKEQADDMTLVIVRATEGSKEAM